MGNQCGCGENEDPAVVARRMHNLIKIQSVVRTFQAMKKKQSIKEEKISQLFGKRSFYDFATSSSREYLLISIVSDKKNHKGAETWMLA